MYQVSLYKLLGMYQVQTRLNWTKQLTQQQQWRSFFKATAVCFDLFFHVSLDYHHIVICPCTSFETSLLSKKQAFFAILTALVSILYFASIASAFILLERPLFNSWPSCSF